MATDPGPGPVAAPDTGYAAFLAAHQAQTDSASAAQPDTGYAAFLAAHQAQSKAAQPMALGPLAGHSYLAGAAQWPATTVGTPAVAGHLATAVQNATQPQAGGSALGNAVRGAAGTTLGMALPGVVPLVAAGGTAIGNVLAPITDLMRKWGEDVAPQPTPQQVGPGLLRQGLAAGANVAGNATAGGLVGAGAGAAGRAVYDMTPLGRILKALGTSDAGAGGLASASRRLQTAGRGELTTAADLDPVLAKTLGKAASANPDVASKAATFFEARAKGAPDRLASDVAEAAKTAHPEYQHLLAKVAADNPGATADEVKQLVQGGGGTLYGAARGVEDQPALAKQAVRAWNQDGSRSLTTLMQGLAPQDAQHVRTVLTNRLVDQLESGKVPEGSSAFQNKLEAIFPDKNTFDDLVGQVEAERHLARTAGLAAPVANPPSRLSLQAMTRLGQAGLLYRAITGIAHPATAMAEAATTAVPEIARAANRAIAGRVGSRLLGQGPEMQALLAHLAQATPPTTLGGGLLGGASAGTSAGASGLLGPQGQVPGQPTGLLGRSVTGP